MKFGFSGFLIGSRSFLKAFFGLLVSVTDDSESVGFTFGFSGIRIRVFHWSGCFGFFFRNLDSVFHWSGCLDFIFGFSSGIRFQGFHSVRHWIFSTVFSFLTGCWIKTILNFQKLKDIGFLISIFQWIWIFLLSVCLMSAIRVIQSTSNTKVIQPVTLHKSTISLF